MPLSGQAMIRLYQQSGWRVVSQRGSHVKMALRDKIAIIPMHKELKKGTESALLKRLAGEQQ